VTAGFNLDDGRRRREDLILPRQGEVAGTRQTVGEDMERGFSLAAPSVRLTPATFPWRGRIEKVRS
jgi:hypothetical protein